MLSSGLHRNRADHIRLEVGQRFARSIRKRAVNCLKSIGSVRVRYDVSSQPIIQCWIGAFPCFLLDCVCVSLGFGLLSCRHRRRSVSGCYIGWAMFSRRLLIPGRRGLLRGIRFGDCARWSCSGGLRDIFSRLSAQRNLLRLAIDDFESE